jgi:hypothetical protein
MIATKLKTVFECRCERPECRHGWDALTKPKRCAKCKYYTWNGEDKRFTKRKRKVSGSRIKIGQKAPRAPRTEDLLESFTKARRIIAQIIEDNPGDNASETEVVAQIDRHIAKLKTVSKPETEAAA